MTWIYEEFVKDLIILKKEKRIIPNCRFLRQGVYCKLAPLPKRRKTKERGIDKYFPKIKIKIDPKFQKCWYNNSRNINCGFMSQIIYRNCDSCAFNDLRSYPLLLFYDPEYHKLRKGQLSKGYCTIFEKYLFFKLQKPCPFHTYQLYELQNPFFHNNRICPYCNEEVKKGSEKGYCRIQIGKKYQWFHTKCKKSSGLNPMGFDNIKLKLML